MAKSRPGYAFYRISVNYKIMFTGIIKEVGTVTKVDKATGGGELRIACDLAQKIAVDQSININGVCHTAVAATDEAFTVQTVEETLRKTNMGEIEAGDKVNLEPSLRAGQELDGHIVQGHVDTTGKITSIQPEDRDHLFTIAIPDTFNDLIVERGSIAIDGISLTIAEASAEEFKVAIIPFTYGHTAIQHRETGDTVNLEFDILGKYISRYLDNRAPK